MIFLRICHFSEKGRTFINKIQLSKIPYSTNCVKIIKRRGLIEKIFPNKLEEEFVKKLSSSQCTIYLGIDPTMPSLHLGNLLPLMTLLQLQRAGHNAIVVLGSATSKLGDPSGRNKERSKLNALQIKENINSIQIILEKIQNNFKSKFDEKNTGSFLILNNGQWYNELNVIEFLYNFGFHFRISTLLKRESIDSRLQSEKGLNLNEFIYQIFQSYDWLHLYEKFNCSVQIGGGDQFGNILSGHELIHKVKQKTVYGITVPLLTSTTGEKIGKTTEDAIWLDGLKTSAYDLYQYCLNISDEEVEKFLFLFTFLSQDYILDLMKVHKQNLAERQAQKELAKQIVKLIHGQEALEIAEKYTNILFGNRKDSIKLIEQLEGNQLVDLFKNAKTSDILFKNSITVFDLCLLTNSFNKPNEAKRTIRQGGIHINDERVFDCEFKLSKKHILNNGVTIMRIGKKNYQIIKWLQNGTDFE